MKEITIKLDATGLRFAIVTGRFNDPIGDRLLVGAKETLLSHGVCDTHITSITVPGAFEIPLMLRHCAEKKEYDALIALGAVIRGETAHFDYVAGEAARGVQQVSLDYAIPVAFGILTCDTLEQALERSGGKEGNKGVEAALVAIEMAQLMKIV